MKKRMFIITGCCIALLAAGQFLMDSRNGKKCQKQLFAMDTYMEFTAYGKNCEEAVDAAMEEVQRLDNALSAQDTDSEVYELNNRGSIHASGDLYELVSKAEEISRETDGLFDPTIYPVMKLWGFPTGNYRIPAEQEIAAALLKVDYTRIALSEEDTITLGENQEIDLGGIAKGYTGQKLTEIFRQYGVDSALVSLGGNVQAIGSKPDGSSWKVGIRDPEGSQQDYVGVLAVQDEAVVTSGGYERYFEENNEKYIHIIDTRTGYPAKSDLLSVTIVAEDGTLADGLSTALYVMGYQKALEFWMEHQENFDVIFITDTHEIYVSPDLEEKFQSEENWNVINAADRESADE